jgi:4-amino-4-deoxy-L-arabinose transferase-like glycosyltransferase
MHSIRKSPFWTAFWIIFLIAAAIRLLTFARGLPYIIEVDEPNIYTTVQGWRGLFRGPILEGYPPVILSISYAVQTIADALGHPGAADTIYVMRLLSVGYSLGTLVFITLIARRIAGDIAALVAGACWGISTLIAEYSINAQADPLAFLLVATSLYLVIVSAQDRTRRHWCVYSFFVGLLAVLTKYPLFPVLIPAGLIALYVLLRENRIKGLRFLGIQVGLTGIILFWLVVIYHVQEVTAQTPGLWANFKSGLTATFVENLVSNFGLAMQPINVTAVLVAWLLGFGAYVLAGRLKRKRVLVVPVLLLAFTAILLDIVSGLMTQAGAARWRDVLPPAPLIMILFGVAVWQIIQIMPRRSASPSQWSHISSMIRTVPLALVFVVILVPQAANTVDYVRVNRLETTQLAVRLWAQINLEPAWVIVNGGHARTFNTIFGGIRESKWFPWWNTNTISDHTIAEWRQMNMEYAVLEDARVQQFEQTAAGRDYMSNLFLLRSFPGLPTYLGSATSFYRLWPPQIATKVSFTDSTAIPKSSTQIDMVGYDLTDSTKKAIGDGLLLPGNEYQFTLYWKAASRPLLDYSVYIHIRPVDNDTIVAQSDGSPGITERPTSSWNDLSETIIGRPLVLKLPDHVPAGRYRVIVGLYDSASGRHLITSDGKRESELFELTIN